ncbi:MAG: nitroreductase [Clostridia bacterium]|nr:nitroreductase [Clostridia bacterium]
MELIEAMKQRHSVRQYWDKEIPTEILSQLQTEIDACNHESGLHIQLVTNEPKAFDSFMAHYGKFNGVKNYIALVGKKNTNLDELCGYYGERIVLKAQQLGLNTCWVALTYKKVPHAFTIKEDEKLLLVISLGYGKTQGVARKSKTKEQISNANEETPDWFQNGIDAVLLAPTAMNQQKFKFTYQDGKVFAKASVGFYTKVDLGIAKYHFELGSGKKIL